jgi:hypothetical protein
LRVGTSQDQSGVLLWVLCELFLDVRGLVLVKLSDIIVNGIGLMIENINLILIESLLLQVLVHQSLSREDFDSHLVALEPSNFSVGHKDFGVVLVAAISVHLLANF